MLIKTSKLTTQQWSQGLSVKLDDKAAIKDMLMSIEKDIYILNSGDEIGFGIDGQIGSNDDYGNDLKYSIIGTIPSIMIQNLGNSAFRKRYNLKYNYVVGEMAHGITSIEMVEKAANAGLLGMFGTGGLQLGEIDQIIFQLKRKCGDSAFGMNLLCNPINPEYEFDVVNKFLSNEIRIVSASAYTNITLPLVYYRVKGLQLDSAGDLKPANRIIAKISRPEIATRFLSPPPNRILLELKERSLISDEEYMLGSKIPMADDLIIEGNSGGHTDNGVISCIFPEIKKVKIDLVNKYKYSQPIHLGIAGGIGTPDAVASAFVLGADFIVTGSINQSCMEAGTSRVVKELLALTKVADVTMVPSSDMFESGAKVQVLRRGNLYHARAKKLYDMYLKYNDVDELSATDLKELENILQLSISDAWEQTKSFFEKRDLLQIEKAEKNPKFKLSLILRSYLGKSSKWAINGDNSRQNDYQIWCGPSMGAFNSWVKNSELESIDNRSIVNISKNLLNGGAYFIRLSIARCLGIALDESFDEFKPLLFNN
jgi:PfaD family protein